MTRRTFLAALVSGVLSAREVLASYAFEDRGIRRLNLRAMNFNENLDIVYYENGIYDEDALSKINRLMRCRYSGEIIDMDRKSLDILCNIKDALSSSAEISIVCGYRSPKYNAIKARRTRSVSKKSLHMEGRAIDFAIDSTPPRTVASVARALAVGGVGSYPKFVHIDSGPVYFW